MIEAQAIAPTMGRLLLSAVGADLTLVVPALLALAGIALSSSCGTVSKDGNRRANLERQP